MPLDSHIIVPCVLTDGGRLFVADPIVAGMAIEFRGWWWARYGNDPAWPHGVFKMIPQEVSRDGRKSVSEQDQAA